jgi:hypothetical protein
MSAGSAVEDDEYARGHDDDAHQDDGAAADDLAHGTLSMNPKPAESTGDIREPKHTLLNRS